MVWVWEGVFSRGERIGTVEEGERGPPVFGGCAAGEDTGNERNVQPDARDSPKSDRNGKGRIGRLS